LQRARCACDGQAALLRRGKVRNWIVRSPRPGLAQEQSGREFASADTTAGTEDAAFQIAGIQLSASCPFTPPSKTHSTSSAISPPAARSASSEKKRSRGSEQPPRREPKLGLPDCERPNSVLVTAPSITFPRIAQIYLAPADIKPKYKVPRTNRTLKPTPVGWSSPSRSV
jgi:hypothetical protein